MLKLRDYQLDCLRAIQNLSEQGENRLLVSLPTGAGKTVIFSHLVRNLGKRSLILAHTNELLEQARDKIKMLAPELDVGLVNGSSKQFDSPVVVCSIQSARVTKNLEKLKKQDFEVLIFDECHHSAADSPKTVLNELGFGAGTEKLLVGFSATAFRGDGKGLRDIFDVIAFESSTRWMIENGYLCKPTGVRVETDLDLNLVASDSEDFRASSLAKVMNTPELNCLVVDSYEREGEGRQAICFGVDVSHASNLCEEFKARGISSELIAGTTPKEERNAAIDRYKSGDINVLCNCLVLTEGFDAPETSCVVVARPTKSRALYSQMVGRGLRLAPNKSDCLVIDFCDQQHSICNAAELLGDAEVIEAQQREERAKKKELLKRLPINLNQRLKTALVNFDPLGETFLWQKNEKGVLVLKGANVSVGIVPEADDMFSVLLKKSDNTFDILAEGISFDYAFGTAEDYARGNRSLFAVSDREAGWRDEPISQKQIELLQKFGFRVGIEALTRGQACDLIASGALRRNR